MLLCGCRRYDPLHFAVDSRLNTSVFWSDRGADDTTLRYPCSAGPASVLDRGRLLGRPKVALGKPKLDGKEEEIKKLLEKEVSKSSIAKIVEVSRTALLHFVRRRKLDPRASIDRARARRP